MSLHAGKAKIHCDIFVGDILQMTVLFLSAFAMSIAFAIQPGIIGFESLRRGVSHGWTAALHVELGSLLGDGVLGADCIAGGINPLSESCRHAGIGALWMWLAAAVCLGGVAGVSVRC